MRPCTTRPPASRTWTVELRPQPQGPRLVCAQCGLTPKTLQGRTARSAALAHLARHARLSLLPQHLRTCQCHERGCRWHPRHRGCDGPLLLVLSREHGGRLWRLADSCTACARAMKDACIVPDTTLTMPPAARRANRPVTAGRRPAGLQDVDRSLVRNMLSHLATSLPAGISPQARLVALQCVLRATPDGRVRLPAGLIRGMGLSSPRVPGRSSQTVAGSAKAPVPPTNASLILSSATPDGGSAHEQPTGLCASAIVTGAPGSLWLSAS
ncbi:MULTISPECIES: hypothetical protein [unclassified Streptomyces]|uniref:hypothetical protein n=1 Tax=unclassified Streptomyces TaxID=2593676 RepID=UPI0011B942F6|nr:MULTISPECIES: hypothetical protein [unclassified Streptomyces]